MSRPIRGEDLDPDTRQTLVALATPEPLIGAPEHRLFRDVLGGDTQRLVDEVVDRRHEFVSNEPHGHPQRHGWVLAEPPPAADGVVADVRDRLHRLAVELRLGPEFESVEGDGPKLVLSDVVVTAHCDGDFLGPHHDDGWPGLRNGRLLSFVYWFHDQPRRFDGGSLRLVGWRRYADGLPPTGPAVELPPDNDSLVVFPSCTRHELQAVRCVPDEFRAARFALVGFIRRAPESSSAAGA